MKFRIEVSGTHEEGPEARTRFDKVTRSYIEQLGSNGFIADYAVSSPDMKLNPVSLLLAKGGDPEPASWQAATLSDAERAPAKAEAAVVATANQPSISKAAERITDNKLQPEISRGTGANTETGTEAADATVTTDLAPTDAELEKTDDPKLALAPGTMTIPALKAFLAENDYTVAEFDAALAEELAGKNRDEAVRAIKQSRDARVEAEAATP